MKNVKYEVPGISCGHCVNTIQVELGKMSGINEVWADQDTKKVEVEFDDPASEESIKDLLATINYPVKD